MPEHIDTANFQNDDQRSQVFEIESSSEPNSPDAVVTFKHSDGSEFTGSIENLQAQASKCPFAKDMGRAAFHNLVVTQDAAQRAVARAKAARDSKASNNMEVKSEKKPSDTKRHADTIQRTPTITAEKQTTETSHDYITSLDVPLTVPSKEPITAVAPAGADLVTVRPGKTNLQRSNEINPAITAETKDKATLETTEPVTTRFESVQAQTTKYGQPVVEFSYAHERATSKAISNSHPPATLREIATYESPQTNLHTMQPAIPELTLPHIQVATTHATNNVGQPTEITQTSIADYPEKVVPSLTASDVAVESESSFIEVSPYNDSIDDQYETSIDIPALTTDISKDTESSEYATYSSEATDLYADLLELVDNSNESIDQELPSDTTLLNVRTFSPELYSTDMTTSDPLQNNIDSSRDFGQSFVLAPAEALDALPHDGDPTAKVDFKEQVPSDTIQEKTVEALTILMHAITEEHSETDLTSESVYKASEKFMISLSSAGWHVQSKHTKPMSLELTNTLLQFFGSLGYTNPSQAIVEIVRLHGYDFLITHVYELAKQIHDAGRPEIADDDSFASMISSTSQKRTGIEKAIFGLLAHNLGLKLAH